MHIFHKAKQDENCVAQRLFDEETSEQIYLRRKCVNYQTFRGCCLFISGKKATVNCARDITIKV